MGSCAQTVAMKASVFLSVLAAGLAALKAAIAAGLVKGFPGSGAGRGGAGDADRSGRQFVAPTPAPVCGCSQKRLHQELDNMRKQMAALQKAMNTIAPLVMDIPMCA